MRVLLAAVSIAVSLVGSTTVEPPVQTLYRSPDGPIEGFAQDGSMLAWFAPGKGRCNEVHLLSLDGAGVTLPDQSAGQRNVTCRWTVTGPIRLALAGTYALWGLHEQAPVAYDYVVGAGGHDRRERRFREIAHADNGSGYWLGGLAGDGSTLVYSVVAVSYANQLGCLSGGSCAKRVSGGGVYRVVGRRDLRIAGIGPALDVAASGTRVAYIPASSKVDPDGHPLASATLPVEVREAATGGFVSRVDPVGVPEQVALSSGVLAVLERTQGGALVEWFDPSRGGNRLGVVSVPDTATDLSTSDQLIAFRVGRSLRVIDIATGTVRTLATAASTPIGLSLEGSRLAWAENVDGRGRIRALFLDGRG